MEVLQSTAPDRLAEVRREFARIEQAEEATKGQWVFELQGLTLRVLREFRASGLIDVFGFTALKNLGILGMGLVFQLGSVMVGG